VDHWEVLGMQVTDPGDPVGEGSTCSSNQSYWGARQEAARQVRAARRCTKARLLRQKKAHRQRIEQQQERRHQRAQIGDGDPDPLLLTNMCRVKDRFNHKNLLGTSVTVQGRRTTALVDTGCEAKMVLSRRFADRIGVSYTPIAREVGLPDGSRMAAARSSLITLEVAGVTRQETAVVLDLVAFDCILGLPWLEELNPVINWKRKKLLVPVPNGAVEIDLDKNPCRSAVDTPTLLSTMKIQELAKKGEPVYLVTLKAQGPGKEEVIPEPASLPQGWDQMIKDYADVFPEEHPGLPPDRSVQLEINLEAGALPASKPAYRLSPAEMDELKTQLAVLLEKGLIRPSTSPWGAPVLFAPKTDGGLRMCLDYRALNKVTIKDKNPIPRVDEIFDRLQGAKYFSTLDLRSGYYQIKVREEDVPKTCIRTRYGSFEFLVMPFGVTNAPSVFQALMNSVFRDVADVFVMCYLDDILVYSKTATDHQQHVKEVLQRLRDEKLFCKRSKCHFSQQQVKFLGHVVSDKGISMQQDKVGAVRDWPTPSTKVELQAFLGLANYYRRFIHNFSAIVAPLTDATRGDKKAFKWGGPQDLAFEAIKEAFTSAPVLRLPDPEKPFTVTTDASNFGIGGVLEQEWEDGAHPVAYISRKLNDAERNYPTHDREFLAIVYVVKELRCYLHGSAFVIRTDHHPLRYLNTQPHLSKRQVRWLDALAEYDYEIKYLAGKWNVLADALSRRSAGPPSIYTGEDDEGGEPPMMMSALSATHILPHEDVLADLVRDYLADPSLRQEYINPEKYKKADGLLYDAGGRLVVPDGKLRLVLMHDAHDAIIAGHLGTDKSLATLQRHFSWPGMRSQVAAYVTSCDRCQRDKASNQRPIGLLQPLEVPSEPWEHVSLDFIMSLPPSGGFDAILVVVDKLSKSMVLIPTQTTVSAKETARLYFNYVYCRHGLARKVISDRDVRFTGKFWQELHKLLQVKLAMSSSFHPQTDGQTERANRTLEEMVRHYVAHHQRDWAALLPALEFAYNSSKHRATGVSPFYVCTGRNPVKFEEVLLPTEPKTPAVGEHVGDLLTRAKAAATSICLYNEVMAREANSSRRHVEFDIGDKVLLSTKFFKPPSSTPGGRKFAPKFAGPYEVIAKVSPVAYKLQLPEGTNAHPVFHSSLLRVYHPDSTGERTHPVPEPVRVDGQVEFAVEKIIQERRRYGKLEYLVHWKGYPAHDATWEPIENVDGSEALLDFRESRSGRSVANTSPNSLESGLLTVEPELPF
jgi:predicted aspartyl protease/transposase InsO family protein